jgi:hypothetical protein
MKKYTIIFLFLLLITTISNYWEFIVIDVLNILIGDDLSYDFDSYPCSKCPTQDIHPERISDECPDDEKRGERYLALHCKSFALPKQQENTRNERDPE